MINITTYITEKLRINDDTKLAKYNTKFTPKEEELKQIDKAFSKRNGFDSDVIRELKKSCRNKVTAIRYWLGVLFKTNSVPFIHNNKMCSYPANYGKELAERAVELGADLEEIYFQYDMHKDEHICDVSEKLEAYYKEAIETVLKIGFQPKEINTKLKYELKYYIPEYGDNYSNVGKEYLYDKNGYVVMPFDLTYEGKTLQCEFIFTSYATTYYKYKCEDKYFMNSSQFIQEVLKEFELI